MKILAICQTETDEVMRQIEKQTVLPDEIFIYADQDPAKGIENRRLRIAENHETMLKPYVQKSDADLIWQVEGDCELADDTLERLIADYEILKTTPYFGYISGIQVGRHGLYCLGAWTNFEEDSFESLDYTLKGIQPVEATGFYCLLAPKDVWLSGTASWHGEAYGPDVVWSLSLDRNIYCDMDLQIGHRVKSGIIKVSDMSTCNARFYKENDRWEYEQL